MSNKKNYVKFEELIKLCKEGVDGITAMAFSPEKSFTYGLNNTMFQLSTGFYYSNSNNEVKIIGNINKVNISNRDVDLENKVEQPDQNVTIIADSRNLDKPTLFVSESEILKFNKKTKTDEELIVVIYWEIGDYSYLAYVLKNPINEEIIVDAIFVTSSYQKDVNRVNCLRLLDYSTRNKLIPLFSDVVEDGTYAS